MKNFADLTEREVLAVAISAEEEDSRIYMSFGKTSRSVIRNRPRYSRKWPRRKKAIATCCWKCTSSVSAKTCPPSEGIMCGDFFAAARSG